MVSGASSHSDSRIAPAFSLDASCPPSRDANPFATCWTHPGALPFVPPTGDTLDQLVECLEANRWRGQIIGPHGAGKSTLLTHLIGPIEKSGKKTVRVAADQGAWRDALTPTLAPNDVILLEGFERLGWADRRAVLRRCRLTGCGCLAPTHRRVKPWPESLPVVARLETTVELALSLYRRLVSERPSPVGPDEVVASFAANNGDLREVWFDLYNHHEQAMRPGRTAAVFVA